MKIRKIRILLLSFSLVVTFSCDSNEERYSKPNKTQYLIAGEWLDIKDSTSGISVRQDKLGFFENMKFSSDDVYEYSFIDSLKKANGNEEKIGEYIILRGINDTLREQVIMRQDSMIEIKLNNSVRTFKWKLFTKFKNK